MGKRYVRHFTTFIRNPFRNQVRCATIYAMLIPRFTVRKLFILTTVSGLAFLLVSFGFQGHHWAVGISVTIASLLLIFLLYGMLFGVTWTLSRMFPGRSSGLPANSPFAEHRSPPQVIPEDSE